MNAITLQIPTNTLPYLLASVATLIVGIRSTQNYLRLKSPFSRHFAISGFLAAVSLGLYAFPFYFTNDPQTLRVCLVIGRGLIDVVAYLQLWILWYLTPLKRFSPWWFVGFALIVGVPGYISQVIHIYQSPVQVNNNLVPYSISTFASYTHLVSLLVVFLAGAVLCKEAFLQTETRAKIRLLSIALLYLFASLGDIYNTIFLGTLNNSGLVLIAYLIGTGVFIVSTLFVLRKKR